MKRQLNQREESILLLLKKFDFLTRDQINSYFKIGTIRHTNRVLQGLSKYLMKVRGGYQTIYYLSKLGREYVDCGKIRKKGGHIHHAIMRNDIWLYFDCPKGWKNEIKVSDGFEAVVVDAMFTDSWDRKHFVEVDNTQTMKENRSKIKRYKDLYEYGAIESELGHFPTIVWLTTTEHRRNQLKDACEGLPIVMVFTVNDIK